MFFIDIGKWARQCFEVTFKLYYLISKNLGGKDIFFPLKFEDTHRIFITFCSKSNHDASFSNLKQWLVNKISEMYECA